LGDGRTLEDKGEGGKTLIGSLQSYGTVVWREVKSKVSRGGGGGIPAIHGAKEIVKAAYDFNILLILAGEKGVWKGKDSLKETQTENSESCSRPTKVFVHKREELPP